MLATPMPIGPYTAAYQRAYLFQDGSHQKRGEQSLGHSGKAVNKDTVAEFFYFFHDFSPLMLCGYVMRMFLQDTFSASACNVI